MSAAGPGLAGGGVGAAEGGAPPPGRARRKGPLVRNIAAHLASGQAPRIAFTQIAAAGRSAPPKPLFVLGPGNAAVHEELFAQTELGEVGCYAIEDAILAPTGVAMKDGVAFSAPAFLHPSHHVAAVAGRIDASDLPTHHVAGTLAVIYGPGHETYGHWLVDFLPRLWVLSQCGHDLHTLRYAVPPNLVPVAIDLLGRVGVRPSQLVLHRYWWEVLRAEMLLMPTGLRTLNRLSPLFAQATASWTGALHRAAARLPGQGPRIFLSRAGLPSARHLANRAAIEGIAAARGYAVVRPQTLRLPDQVALFAHARVIAGEYGSALHGAVFSRAGTLSLALRGNVRHPSFVQSGVAAALGQQVAYVLGHTQGDVDQNVRVQPEDFERALDIAEIVLRGQA